MTLGLASMEKPADAFFWTAATGDESEMTTEDPLGLDYIAQQVGLLLLPALTTRSTRAQAFAMVLYGLSLAEEAVVAFSLPNTDEQKRELFERWERLWALATLEYRRGALPRGDWDAMRGIRGARRAWRDGDRPLSLDFALISRQQELGNLGAYLVPLRNAGLIAKGTVKPTAAADEVIQAFWDEPSLNQHVNRYHSIALATLEPGKTSIERKSGNITLAKIGEQSRLTSLHHRERTLQRQRLYSLLFEPRHDTHTHAVANLVEAAAKAEIFPTRDILDAALAGQLGTVSSELRDVLVTARAFGELSAELIGAFDRVYREVYVRGWVVPRRDVASAAFDAESLSKLQRVAAAVLGTPAVQDIRRLPMHGAPCLRLAEDLRGQDAAGTLDLLLAYHETVQRTRARGGAWLRDDAGRLVLQVTSYTARPDAPRFPFYKFDGVRTLLTDMGRLPFHDEPLPGVAS